jgi:CRISPR-associated protein Csd2
MSAQEQELWQKIKKKPYCNPTKRMDFVLFFDVRDGNPNGDPDAGNLPRMDPDTRQGIVTDVCIKRKIRDYLAGVLGRSIYIQSQAALNTLYFQAASKIASDEPENDAKATNEEKKQRIEDKKAVEVLLAVLDEDRDMEFKELIAVPEEKPGQTDPPDLSNEEKPRFRDWLASIDVDGLEFDPECGMLSYLGEAKVDRDFKALFTQEEFNYKPHEDAIGKLAKLLAKAKKNKKGGVQERKARDAVKRKMCELYDDIRLFGGVLTAGTNAGQIRGPMQLTFGRSVEPILQMDAAITRCAITTASDWKKKQTEFGRKPWLSWAVYRQHGFYNPLLGQQTGITREDLGRFWEALACMFRNSDSASKGEMTMHDIIVFVHDHSRGNAPSHLLFDKVNCDSVEYKGKNGVKKKDGVTMIKRNGFDNCCTISVDEFPSTKISIERPLRDIWTTND